MSDRYEEIECYECGRLKTRLIWKSRCVTCTVQRLESNLEENDTLRDENAALEEENERLKARIAELEEERDDDQLLNKYAVCIGGSVMQHVYSRVNCDAQSVYDRLVDRHHYNPSISVHFVACEVERSAHDQ